MGAVGRLFVAVTPDQASRLAVFGLLEESLGGRALPGRPVPAGNWHFTLRFLGDTDEVAYERLLSELDRVGWPSPFRVRLGGLGAFPRAARATVLWLGVSEGEEPLLDLAATVEESAQAAGFPEEERPFHPHLTLSRIRPHQDVRPTIEAVPAAGVSFDVDRVVVYRSHLGRGGARYEALERFPFTRA